MYDLCIIGAGPAGLACAIAAGGEGLSHVVIDKGCIANSIYHFPQELVFFSTPELLELANVPFTCASKKPTRREVVTYYRRLVQRFSLQVHQYREVTAVSPRPDGTFHVTTTSSSGDIGGYDSRTVVVATGFFGAPRRLGVAGEELPHVHHYFDDGHPYSGQPVAVIGGGNSAVETALELQRHGAQVSVVHRGAELRSGVKYWVKPEIENRIRRGEVTGVFCASVLRFEPHAVVVSRPDGEAKVPADHVFIQIGYRPDTRLLASLGARIDRASGEPILNHDLRTTLPGVYACGSLVAGNDTARIFIENSRTHGPRIAPAVRTAING